VYKFYFLLWLKWASRLSFFSLFYTTIIAGVITLFIYVKGGMQVLNKELLEALFSVFSFSFMLVFGLSLLLSLFLGLKYIFNDCYDGYSFELLSCLSETKVEKIDLIGYGDLLKVWRKWFMLLIWLVGAQMVFAVILSKIITLSGSLISWFSIYYIYGAILVAGYFSFIILAAKCKRVRIVKC
jgi:hypothetical protein